MWPVKTTIPSRIKVPTTNEISAAGNVPVAFPRCELIGAWSAIMPPTRAVAIAARSVRSKLLRCQPVVADAHVHLQRRVEREGALHLLAHQCRGRLDLGLGPLEQKLVVDREDEPRAHSLLPKTLVGAHHRDLDDVGGGTLDHGI